MAVSVQSWNSAINYFSQFPQFQWKFDISGRIPLANWVNLLFKLEIKKREYMAVSVQIWNSAINCFSQFAAISIEV
jgi:hypothetical protein